MLRNPSQTLPRPSKAPKLPDESDLKRALGSGFDPTIGNTPYRSQTTAKVRGRSDKPPNPVSAMLDLFHVRHGEAFRSLDGQPLVCLTDGNRRQTFTVNEAVLELARLHFEATGQPTAKRHRSDVQDHLEALARSGPKRQTWIRVAEHEGALYLDLGDDSWRAVQITSDGWQIIDRPPVYFVRSAGMLPLPVPVNGGNVAELFDIVNLPDRPSQVLALSWFVAALRPSKPLPVLAFLGEAGSGKTWAASVFQSLIDPHQATLRADPADMETVLVGAANAWILAYDNLSTLPVWFSDTLCRLSTGASFTARAKYTDRAESILSALCPVILVGIESLITRTDLADRAIGLTLPPLPEGQKRTLRGKQPHFRDAHPRILGGILDAVAHALRTLPTVPEPQVRMADFAQFAIAAETALGLAPGEFLSAYRENKLESHEQALDSCPIVEPLERFMSTLSEWSGTATELLAGLARLATDDQRTHRGWPKDATRLAAQLRRVAPSLPNRGYHVETTAKPTRSDDRKVKRLITIQKVPQ